MSFRRALEIINKNDIHMPKEFARLMWPNSEGWKRMHKCGRGASWGAMMPMAGGGLLGKLRAKDFIRTPWGDDRNSYYSLTEKGREYLGRE